MSALPEAARLSAEDAEEYTQALGQVVAGGWRQVALGKRLGVPQALGITTEEWVEDRLGGYIRMSIPDRREAVVELVEEGMSTREIGEVLGVSHATVATDVKNLTPEPEELALEVPQEEAVVKDLTPSAAEKDRDRKVRSDAVREAKQEEDARAPEALAEFVQGDCRELASTLQPGAARLLLTDPPYGADYRSGYRWASEHASIAGDDKDAIGLFCEAVEACRLALADDAHLLVFCRWQEEPTFTAALSDLGFTIRSSAVWVKNEHGMGDLRHSFGPAHERILHATLGDARMRYREPDVLRCARVVSERHPTEKPVELLERLIRATTDPDDLVLDPFAGVASTLVAATGIGRRAWGCEIDDTYHRAGAERLVA